DRHLSSEASLLSKALTLRFSSEEQVFENMRSLGLGHLFSVSGLHVGLLALFFSFFLSFLLPTVKMRQLMSVFLLWMYALMVGFTPSITRAVLLYTLYVIKKLYIPYWSEMDILSGVAGIAILWNPYVVFNVGFQLSYLAVFGMIYFLPKWKGRRVFFGILGDGIVVLLSVQLMTLPFVIYYFNSYHGLNFLWNLLFVPLFTIYVMLSFTYLLLQSIPYVGFFISSILNLLAHGILWTTTHLQWKEMLWVLPSPSISWFLLYFTIIFVGGYKIPYQYVRYHQLRKMFYLLILCVLPGFFSLSPIRSVEFLSVGQGDAALISIGSKHYLIDTGGEGRRPGHIGKFVLEPYLVKSGRRKLDGVFITHFDYDHYGALIEMSDRIKMQHIISDHEPPDHVKKVLQENNLHFTIVPNDSVFKLGKGYFLRAIPYEKSRLDENGRSLVLQLVKGEESLVLFTGDITEAEEKKLLRYPLHSMVLKCPHHGSKSSSSEDFLIHVAPKDVAISVGYKNSFGHPHQEVLKRYRHHSIEIHRTDTQGLLQFDLRRHTWSHYKEEQELPIYFKLYAIYTTIIVGFTVLRIRREQWNICHF
ncbi:MAG: DNA internalization-related competence protein ComEC/Rec2, partial [Tissierellia bacterium]|nr:DNA internalization-related competence protein ComEC/Rec2 [Tissierellia bacterium]